MNSEVAQSLQRYSWLSDPSCDGPTNTHNPSPLAKEHHYV